MLFDKTAGNSETIDGNSEAETRINSYSVAQYFVRFQQKSAMSCHHAVYMCTVASKRASILIKTYHLRVFPHHHLITSWTVTANITYSPRIAESCLHDKSDIIIKHKLLFNISRLKMKTSFIRSFCRISSR